MENVTFTISDGSDKILLWETADDRRFQVISNQRGVAVWEFDSTTKSNYNSAGQAMFSAATASSSSLTMVAHAAIKAIEEMQARK